MVRTPTHKSAARQTSASGGSSPPTATHAAATAAPLGIVGTLRTEGGGEVGVLGEGDRRREHREEQRRFRRQKADDAEDERREHRGAQNACHQRPATTGLLIPP